MERVDEADLVDRLRAGDETAMAGPLFEQVRRRVRLHHVLHIVDDVVSAEQNLGREIAQREVQDDGRMREEIGIENVRRAGGRREQHEARFPQQRRQIRRDRR